MTVNENLIKWVNKELSNLLDFDIGEEYARYFVLLNESQS